MAASVESKTETADASPRGVAVLETASKQREGAGFVVRRPLGSRTLDYIDPFLMLDHFGPVTHGPGEAVGAPDHPHRGFETVSYMLQGEFEHKDSQGNSGTLGPGWCQWMTAGSGVVHSEMPSERIRREGGTIEGFQLWVNLPAKLKMTHPRYQDTPPERLPVVDLPEGAGSVKVIAGEGAGAKANIETHTPIMYVDVRLNAGGSYTQTVPESYNAFAYVYGGRGTLGKDGTAAKEGQIAVMSAGGAFTLTAAKDSELNVLLIGGEPIGEPVARHGPFVMNTREEIYKCFEDYQSGRMGEIEGAEERYAESRAAVSKQKKTGTWKRDEEGL